MKKLSVVSCKVSFKRLSFIISLFLFSIYWTPVAASDEMYSRAAVVVDASTGRILYGRNTDLRLPPASTTKLMTAIVTLERANLSEVVGISKNATHVARIKAGFIEGDKVTIEDLLYASLVGSANDAAVVLAEAVAGSEEMFVRLMNLKTLEIGVKDTKFVNSHGLPGPGQYTTAVDLSEIMRYALRYPKLREIIGTRVTEVVTEKGDTLFIKNTNELMWSDEYLIGGKTGYTLRARHCFVGAAKRDEETIIVALLGSPSRKNLWKEAQELIDRGFEVLANREEPLLYFTRADNDHINIKKASDIKCEKVQVKNKRIARSSKHNNTKLIKKQGEI